MLAPSRKSSPLILVATMLWCQSCLGGCARLRAYNPKPETRLRRAVEGIPLEQVVRLQLSSGRVLEGALLFRDWPQLTLGAGDSLHVPLDAREITVLWQAKVDKSLGGLVGAVFGATLFSLLAYGFIDSPPCSSGPCDDEWWSGSNAAWVTLAAGALGAGVGLTFGAFVSEGRPGWQKLYPQE